MQRSTIAFSNSKRMWFLLYWCCCVKNWNGVKESGKNFWCMVVIGPVHICSRYTTPGKMFSKQVLGTRAFRWQALWNVLGTPSFRFKIGTHLGLRSMTYCVWHCATCEVILTCTLRADSGLRAKPRPVRTCSRFLIVQTSFRRRTKGAICSENKVRPCSSWNCSSGNTTL